MTLPMQAGKFEQRKRVVSTSNVTMLSVFLKQAFKILPSVILPRVWLGTLPHLDSICSVPSRQSPQPGV